MISRISNFLQVKPGEGRLVGLIIALFFLPNMGAAIGSPSVEALFFSRFGVEFLPYMYIALGVAASIVALTMGGLLGRLSKKRLYLSLPPLIAITMILSRIMIAFDPTWFYPVLWLWVALLWTVQGLFTWGLAGMVCDTRQAKRLFPLFGAGGILGIAFGGLVTRPLVSWIGTENLLLVWSGLLLAAFLVVNTLLANVKEPRRSSWRPLPTVLGEIQKGYDYVRRTALMQWIALAAALFSVLFFSLIFPFSKGVAAQFPDEDSITGFLGVFNGSMTSVAFITSLVFANRLYARFGFITAILILPLVYLLGFGSMIVLSAPFIALAVFRFSQMVWLLGMTDIAYQALFNIVPESYREQTRTFVRGIPEQAGTILTGAIMAVGSNTLQDQNYFVIGMAAAVITVFAVWRAGRAYRSALADALRAGQPHVFSSEEEPFGGFLKDADAFDTLLAGLSDSDPSVRLISAEILGNLAEPAATPALVSTLEDFDPNVRITALKALARTGIAAALLEIAASLHDHVPEVRCQAVLSLSQLANHPRGVRIHLAPLLDDPDPRVRAQASASLLKHGKYPPAESVLFQMASAANPETRIAALEALAIWGDPSCFEIIAAGLRDAHPSIRKVAAIAIAKIDDEHVPEILVSALADDVRSVREAVATSLCKLGTRTLPHVVAALKDPVLESGAMLALACLPAGQAVSDLHSYTREKVNEALRYEKLWRGVVEFASGRPRINLLALALRGKILYHATCALTAIGLLDDPEVMAIAIENLSSRDLTQRSNAVEMLDSLPDREIIKPLIHFWEAEITTDFSKTHEDTARLEEHVLVLLKDSDLWLCTCAVFAAAEIDSPKVHAEINHLIKSTTETLLVETANYVLKGNEMDTLPTIPLMERILYLQKVPLFESLAPADLKQIAAITGEHFFSNGEVIAHQDEPGEEMYIIVSGKVGVVVKTEDGDEKEILSRNPGEHVGEMAIISHEPRMASLVAQGDVRVLCVEKKPFESMLHERPEISLVLMRELIARLRK